MKKLLLLFTCITLFANQNSLKKPMYKALKQAHFSIRQKNYTSAITTLKQLKATTIQEKIHIFTLLSDAYLAKSNHKEASIYLEKLLDISSLDKKKKEHVSYNLLQAYLAQKEYKKATSILVKYKVHVSPKLSANIALAYLQLKKYDKALTYIKKALSKEPKNENFMQILIAIYVSQNNQSQLCATLETAYRLKVLNNTFIKQLAYCLYKKGAPLRGAKVLKKYLESTNRQNSTKLQKLLFSLFFEAKEYEEALKVAKNIHDIKSALLIAQVFFNKGYYAKSINIANSFSFKESPKMKLLQAQSYYYQKNFTKAKKLFQECLNYPSTLKNANLWLKFIEQ